MSLEAYLLSSGSIPPSPVLVAVPARVAPIASAIFASLLRAPKDIAAIIIGVSSTKGFSAYLAPSVTLVLHGSLYLSIGGLETCAGIITRSSKVGITLVAPHPLTLYVPSVDFLPISTMSPKDQTFLLSSGTAFTSIALLVHISSSLLSHIYQQHPGLSKFLLQRF